MFCRVQCRCVHNRAKSGRFWAKLSRNVPMLGPFFPKLVPATTFVKIRALCCRFRTSSSRPPPSDLGPVLPTPYQPRVRARARMRAPRRVDPLPIWGLPSRFAGSIRCRSGAHLGSIRGRSAAGRIWPSSTKVTHSGHRIARVAGPTRCSTRAACARVRIAGPRRGAPARCARPPVARRRAQTEHGPARSTRAARAGAVLWRIRMALKHVANTRQSLQCCCIDEE